ncbi:MAG: folate family ECF transporter S component [Oscillospiraceae bacterium]|nr:folate family ECF transporter S component [Oscillospiraceae bacterium]MBR5362683.1 folate family ECF transporter S component [Oscillospiraceae bacterium]
MKMFRESFKEFKDLRAVVVTGLLIALSMVIESFTINLGFAKINFAFLAIAAIGMLYGPSVSICAGAICDILGYLVAPDGAFFPLYTLIGAMQGLIYGVIAYRKLSKKTGREFDIEMMIRLVIARVADVVFINLICNTAANFHYGFLRDKTLGAAIAARVAKNLLELPIDIILIVGVLMAVLKAYTVVFGTRRTPA